MVLNINNVVRVSRTGKEKEVAQYLEAVIKRFQPETYNRYLSVKIQFHKKALGYVDYILRNLWHLGVRLKDVQPLVEGIDTGRGVILDDCWVATVTKLRVLEEDDDEDYQEFVRDKLNLVRA